MFNNCDITGNSESQGIVEDKRFFQRAEILDYILRGLYRVLKNLFSSGLVIEKNVSEVTNLLFREIVDLQVGVGQVVLLLRKPSMPASEASSRRSSIAVADAQTKPATNLLEPGAKQRTHSANSSKPTGRRKSVSLYPKSYQAGQTDSHPLVPKIANTYKLGPDEDKRFRCKDVKDIIDSVLEARLKGLLYDPDKCKLLLPSIADEIKEKVKVLGFERFKIVCLVTIGKLNNQGVRVASRCLWDTETDRMATSSFCSDDLFATAVVFGVYRE